MDFYDKLIQSDWLGRNQETYIYNSTNPRVGWESSLNKGAAYSSYLINLGKRKLPTKRQVAMAHSMCRSIVDRMNVTKKRLKINFSQSKSYTDVDNFITVNLSSLSGEYKFETVNHAIDPILGFCVHEMAHVLYTDTSIDSWFKELRELNAKEFEIKNHIFQLIEDERIESKISKHFAGYARYLEKAKDYSFVTRFEEPQHKNEVAELLGCFFYMMRYPRKLDRDRTNRFAKELQEIIDILTPFPQTTPELRAATDAIYEVVKRFFEEEKKQEDEDGDGDKGKGGGDSKDEENGDGSGESSGGDEESDEKDNTAGGQDEEGDEMTPEELAEALAEMLEEIAKQQNQGLSEDETMEDVLAKLSGYGREDIQELLNELNGQMAMGDGGEELSESACMNYDAMKNAGVLELKTKWHEIKHPNENMYNDSLNRVGQYASSLRAKMMQLNRAIEVKHTNLAEGTFNQDDLVPALLGSKNVYYEKHRIVNRGCAVTLLVDESGSMNWLANNGQKRIQVARDVAVLFEAALRGVNNVDFFCFGHTTYDNWVSEDTTLMRSYFDGRSKGDKFTLGSITAMAENRDGHAVLEAVARTRKVIPVSTPLVLFVLSDGLPTAGTPDGYSPTEFNRHAIEIVQRQYNTVCVHLAVVDIGDHYKGVFDISVNLTNTNDYVRSIGEVLKRVIMKQQMPVTL